MSVPGIVVVGLEVVVVVKVKVVVFRQSRASESDLVLKLSQQNLFFLAGQMS
jgi:hypothetical protein